MIDDLDLKLSALSDLKPDWDSYGAEIPSPESIGKLRDALTVAREILVPNHLCPSAEGGAALCWFSKEKRYADIEFLNSGEVMACTSLGTCTDDSIKVWEVSDARQAIEKIAQFMAGPAPKGETRG